MLLCRSRRSPSTPELSADELPDDITNEMPDIPNDLELNQEDFSDVLPRLPDDLQDFDLFEGTCHVIILHSFFFKKSSQVLLLQVKDSKTLRRDILVLF